MSDPRRRRAAAFAAAVLALAGCSESDAEGEPTRDPVDAAVADGGPEVAPGEGEAPEGLLRIDLAEGSGPEVEEGSVLTLHYKGVTWSGTEFANTWERGEPLTYTHGEGRWVEGWVAGLDGMRAGGQRRIEVPAELGYADRGAPGIPPGEPIVFVVDLVSVEPGE